MNSQIAQKVLNEYIDDYDNGTITRVDLATRLEEVVEELEADTSVSAYNQGRKDEAEEAGEIELDINLEEQDAREDDLELDDDELDDSPWTDYDTDSGERRP